MTSYESPELDQGEADRLRAQVKAHLRKQARAIRSQLPAESRHKRALAITQRLLASAPFSQASSLAAFVTIRSEVDTRQIIDQAYDQGKRVALPRVCFDTDELSLHWVHKDEPLNENRWDIPEPAPNAPEVSPEELDLILVPGLAADERGHRIGYGRGFYDRLLSRYPNSQSCFLGYDFQLVAEVPNVESDHPVDWIITDSRALECPAKF